MVDYMLRPVKLFEIIQPMERRNVNLLYLLEQLKAYSHTNVGSHPANEVEILHGEDY
jgi:hypothetical protein